MWIVQLHAVSFDNFSSVLRDIRELLAEGVFGSGEREAFVPFEANFPVPLNLETTTGCRRKSTQLQELRAELALVGFSGSLLQAQFDFKSGRHAGKGSCD